MTDAGSERRPEDAPGHSEEMRAILRAARERVDERATQRSASEAIADETTRRPYSLRLTARELLRLRRVAAAEGVPPSELARRLMLEGLLRLEARQLADPDKARLADVVAHLNAQIDATRLLIDRLGHPE